MLNPNEKCAVFLDIDGTLIVDSFKIPEENIRAIAKARKKGHMVFVNTGRSLGNIPEELLCQLKVDGIISGSGSLITFDDRVLYKNCLTCALVKRVYEYFYSHREYWAIFEGKKDIYILLGDSEKQDDSRKILREKDDYLQMSDDIIQVVAVGNEPPEEFIELLKDEIGVFRFDDYVDLVVKGCNKATGIEKVLEITGIKRKNTIAIGDSVNDLDMVSYAGIGVAMANSQQCLIDIADYVTEANNEFGVAKAIEKFLL